LNSVHCKKWTFLLQSLLKDLQIILEYGLRFKACHWFWMQKIYSKWSVGILHHGTLQNPSDFIRSRSTE
jgi:hypothetical protein